MEDQILLPNTLKAGDVGMLLTIGHGLTPLNALPNRTPWRYSDGTSLKGVVETAEGSFVADEAQMPVSDEFYYIVPSKCTECKGFHEEPQCAAVCPVDCCVPDENVVETEAELLEKQSFLHQKS